MNTPTDPRRAPAGSGAPATGSTPATRPATHHTTPGQPIYPQVAGSGHHPATAETPSGAPSRVTRPATATPGADTPWTDLAALLADLDGQHRREREAYAQGYRDGHRSGWDIGHAHAHREMAAHWTTLAAQVRQLARTPTQTDLEHKRWDGPREDFANPRPGDRQSRHLATATTPRRRSA